MLTGEPNSLHEPEQPDLAAHDAADPLILAPAVAALRGWRTATLSNARSRGEGPRNPVYIGTNAVAYHASDVRVWMAEEERKAAGRLERAKAAMAKARRVAAERRGAGLPPLPKREKKERPLVINPGAEGTGKENL